MLTTTEKNRLENRDREDMKQFRARNDLVIRNKLGAWLTDLDDVLFILEHLPEKQLKNVFADDEIVYKIFDLAKIGPFLRQFNQIYGTPQKPFVVENEKTRSANYTDIERAGFVKDLIDDLKENYATDQELLAGIKHKMLFSLNPGGEPYSLPTEEKEQPPK